MILRNLQEAEQTPRAVTTPNWKSVRLVLRDDNVGFSFHITTMFAGTETTMEYVNHVECVYCIAGQAELEEVSTGEKHEIKPGVVYLLNKHDRHIVRPYDDLTIACVFAPAIVGDEKHLPDGSYPSAAERDE